MNFTLEAPTHLKKKIEKPLKQLTSRLDFPNLQSAKVLCADIDKISDKYYAMLAEEESLDRAEAETDKSSLRAEWEGNHFETYISRAGNAYIFMRSDVHAKWLNLGLAHELTHLVIANEIGPEAHHDQSRAVFDAVDRNLDSSITEKFNEFMQAPDPDVLMRMMRTGLPAQKDQYEEVNIPRSIRLFFVRSATSLAEEIQSSFVFKKSWPKEVLPYVRFRDNYTRMYLNRADDIPCFVTMAVEKPLILKPLEMDKKLGKKVAAINKRLRQALLKKCPEEARDNVNDFVNERMKTVHSFTDFNPTAAKELGNAYIELLVNMSGRFKWE